MPRTKMAATVQWAGRLAVLALVLGLAGAQQTMQTPEDVCLGYFDMVMCTQDPMCGWVGGAIQQCYLAGQTIPCDKVFNGCETLAPRCDVFQEFLCYDPLVGIPCLFRPNATFCLAGTDCAFAGGSCYNTKTDAFPCFNFNASACPVNQGCVLQGTGAGRFCSDTAAATTPSTSCLGLPQASCEALPGICAWTGTLCEPDTGVPTGPTAPFTGSTPAPVTTTTQPCPACSGLPQMACFAAFECCSFDTALNTCRDLGCRDLFGSAQCLAKGCQFYQDPTFSDNICYDNTEAVACDVYATAAGCAADVSMVGCAFDPLAQFCKPAGTVTPCRAYRDAPTCPVAEGCRWFPEEFLCANVTSPSAACVQLSSESACTQLGCEYFTEFSAVLTFNVTACYPKGAMVPCPSVFATDVCTSLAHCVSDPNLGCTDCDMLANPGCTDPTTPMVDTCSFIVDPIDCGIDPGCKFDDVNQQCVACDPAAEQCVSLPNCASLSCDVCRFPYCRCDFSGAPTGGPGGPGGPTTAGLSGSCVARGCSDFGDVECAQNNISCALVGAVCLDDTTPLNLQCGDPRLQADAAGCRDPRLSCQFVDGSGCFDSTVQLPCTVFPALDACPGRCQWYADVGNAGACDAPGLQPSCEAYTVDAVCNARPGCAFHYLGAAGLCLGAAQTPNCTLFDFDQSACERAAACDLAAAGASTTAAGGGPALPGTSTCVPCPAGPAGCQPAAHRACATVPLAECGTGLDAHCVLAPDNSRCLDQACSGIFDPFVCDRDPRCRYFGAVGRCGAPDDTFTCRDGSASPVGCGTLPGCAFTPEIGSCNPTGYLFQCAEVFVESVCRGVGPRCTWYDVDFGICRNSSVPLTCDILGGADCVKPPFASRCEFDSNANFCKDKGAATPCSAYSFFDCLTFNPNCRRAPDFTCVNVTDLSTTTVATTTPPNPCTTMFPCHFLTTCVPGAGEAFTCTPCPFGYSGTGLEGCTQILCPAAITAGFPRSVLSGGLCSTSVGSACTLGCTTGFSVSGNATVTCDISGQWVGNLTCQDINECDSSPCDPLTTCTQRATSGFRCSACPSGYTGTGFTRCTDVNECASAFRNGCDPVADCINTPGGATCAPCPSGYEDLRAPQNPGTSCREIDECSTTRPCHPKARCANLPGNFSCTCGAGYTGAGVGAQGCVPVDCGATLPAALLVAGATTQCADTVFEGAAGCTATCPRGMKGSASFTCQADATWTGPALACVPATCTPRIDPAAAGLPAFAYQGSACGTAVGSTCLLGCAAGYGLTTARAYRCDDFGNWVGGALACAACPAGQFQDQPGRPTCKSVRTCAASTFESTAPTTSSDAACSPVTACSEAQFEFRAPGPSSDRVCRSLTNCLDRRQYQSRAPTATANRGCGDCASCPAGSTRAADVCSGNSPLPAGLTPSAADTCTACRGECGLEEYIDVTVGAAPAYCTTLRDTTCRAVSVCPTGLSNPSAARETVAPTATSDRECGARITADTAPDAGRVFVPDSLTITGVDPSFAEPEGTPPGQISLFFTRAILRAIREALRASGYPDAKISIERIVKVGTARRRRLLAVSYVVDYIVDTAVVGGRTDAEAMSEVTAALNDDAALESQLRQAGMALNLPELSMASTSPVEDPVEESDDGGSGGLLIIIIAAVGGLVVVAIIIAVIAFRRKKKGNSASISDNNYEAEMTSFNAMEPDDSITIRPGAVGGAARTRSRQSSFYSSMAAESTEA